MARVWLMIPTFNEVGNIEPVVRAALEQLERVAPEDHRVLIVDDASPDGTADRAERLGASLGSIEVLRRPAKQGLGRAYLAGFERALAGGADLVIVMDADLSHDPAYIPDLLAMATNHDLVLGSRYVDGGSIIDWPRLRRVLSRAGSVYSRRVLGVEVRDLTGGFRCIRRAVLEAVDLRTLRSQGYVFNIELTFRAQQAGFRIAEVPICFRDRTVGESKISLAVAIEALWLVPVLRYPWLGRRWPARKAPMADPELSADPASTGSLPEPAPVPEGASLGQAQG